MKNLSIVLLLVITFFTSTKSFAWGRQGHSIVAQVAFHHLDETTKKTVLKYLDGMTIEQAANWMDEQRGDHNYDFMKPFHYVNFEKGSIVNEPSGDNIIKTLNAALKDLDHINTLSNKEVQTRLFYLFHLIGDLHQPLHVGYGADKGGNTVQVSFFGKGTNLHSVWDTNIIEHKKTTLEDCLKAGKFTAAELTQIQKIDVISWSRESRAFLDQIYNVQNNKIEDAYIEANYKTIELQINKAGIRLTAVLEHYFKNANYKPGPPIAIGAAPIDIAVTDAAKYEGKLVKICSKVYGTKFMSNSKNTPTFLNLGADYPNAPLTILIWGDSRPNFKQKPEEYYNGKNICITGKVIIYKGKPEIIASKEAEIEIK